MKDEESGDFVDVYEDVSSKAVPQVHRLSLSQNFA